MTKGAPLLKMIKEESGQALIETLFIMNLSIGLLSALFYTILTGTQIFIWHQKVNQALMCALDVSQRTTCLREFRLTLGREKKFRLTLKKFNFQTYRQRPSVEIELKGFLSETYKIKKQISSTNWKI